MDDDGYPEQSELDVITGWSHDHPAGYRGLLDYVRERWRLASWGWSEEDAQDEFRGPVRKLYISTAGWSGNEDIVRAMKANCLFWMSCWEQSRRGGHYIFELRDEAPTGGGSASPNAEPQD